MFIKYLSKLKYIIIFIAPLVICCNGPNNRFDNIEYSAMVMIYFFIKYFLIVKSGEFRVLEATFVSFVYVMFGFASFLQLSTGIFPWGGSYSQSLVFKGFLVLVTGLLGYELGLLVGKKQQKVGAKIRHDAVVSHRLLIFFGLFFLLIEIFLIRQLGGVGGFFEPRYFFEKTILENYGVAKFNLITTVMRVPIFILFFLMLMKRFGWVSGRKNNFIEIPVICMLGVLIFIVSNPIITPRYWVGTMVLSITYYYFYKKNKKINNLILMTIVLFVLVFPMADMFRYSSSLSFYHVKYSDAVTLKADYDVFQQLLNVVDYADSVRSTNGRQLLGTIFFWYPRSLWPGKPISTGALVAQHLLQYENVSCPLWGEFYIDFGFPGVFILFCLYGFLTQVIQRPLLQPGCGENMSEVRVLLVFLLAPFQIFILRGSLLSAFALMVPVVGFVILLYLMSIISNEIYRRIKWVI